MKDIAVVSVDPVLIGKIRLMTDGYARVDATSLLPTVTDAYDVILCDARGSRKPFVIAEGEAPDLSLYESGRVAAELFRHPYIDNEILIVWREDARGDELPYPFTRRELEDAIRGRNEKIRLYLEDSRTARLDGRVICLTELEARLLALLISRCGEYIRKEEILSEIWGEGQSLGIVNVYIHYLREKLEVGEKILLSSRKLGYKIDERYIGGK